MIVTGPQVVEWVARRTNEYGNFGCAQGVGWVTGGRLTWGVVFSDFNGVNLNMHVAAVDHVPITRRFLWAVFDYPFNQAKVRRVTGLVGEGNERARRFDEHVGFELETTLKHAHPTGDLLVYCMWKERCRWIGHDFAKRYALAA